MKMLSPIISETHAIQIFNGVHIMVDIIFWSKKAYDQWDYYISHNAMVGDQQYQSCVCVESKTRGQEIYEETVRIYKAIGFTTIREDRVCQTGKVRKN